MSLPLIGSSDYIKPAYSIEPNPLFQCSPVTGGVLNTDDSINIGAFDANAKPNASSQKLQDLYQKKADAQQAVNDSKNEHSDKQRAINDRKSELINSRQSDNKTEQTKQNKELYKDIKRQYDQKNREKTSTANELNQIQQQSSAKDQAINANAQQTQQVTAELNAARSELASLTPPTPPSGDDKNAQANYESQKAAYEERKAAIQAKIDAKAAQQSQLQAAAQQLQSAKDQLVRQQQTKEHAVAQLDGELQNLQANMDKCEQDMSADDPELKKTIEEDQQLQTLQDEAQQAKQEIDAKQSELDAIQTEIDQAESEDSTLQAARSETAHSQLETTAKTAGYDVEASAAAAQETAAREAYGKSYDQLSDEEKISIESKVDGEVTLELMDRARRVLETDPDNSAAQSILEKGGKDLEARQNWAKSNVDNAIAKLPEDLQNRVETAKGIAEGKTDAEGPELDFEMMQEIVSDLSEQLESSEYSDEEKAALRETLNAANAYADSIEQKSAGEDIQKDAEQYLENSDLARMKTQTAEKLGVSEDQLIVLAGTNGDDDISIVPQKDGSLTVNINGTPHTYSAEEAKYLLIDGGKGNDTIKVDDRDHVQNDQYVAKTDLNSYQGVKNVKEPGITFDLNIFGGDGRDHISGGNGNDILYGGEGDDTVVAGDGNDFIEGGEGDDHISGGDGNDIISGSAGEDWIRGEKGDDIISGGDGNDHIRGARGNDVIDGGNGDDEIDAGRGDDAVSGGAGKDRIDAGDGDDIIEGGSGNDTLLCGWGHDIVHDSSGDDRIDPGQGKSYIYDERGRNTIVGQQAAYVQQEIVTANGSHGTKKILISPGIPDADSYDPNSKDHYIAKNAEAEYRELMGKLPSDSELEGTDKNDIDSIVLFVNKFTNKTNKLISETKKGLENASEPSAQQPQNSHGADGTAHTDGADGTAHTDGADGTAHTDGADGTAHTDGKDGKKHNVTVSKTMDLITKVVQSSYDGQDGNYAAVVSTGGSVTGAVIDMVNPDGVLTASGKVSRGAQYLSAIANSWNGFEDLAEGMRNNNVAQMVGGVGDISDSMSTIGEIGEKYQKAAQKADFITLDPDSPLSRMINFAKPFAKIASVLEIGSSTLKYAEALQDGDRDKAVKSGYDTAAGISALCGQPIGAAFFSLLSFSWDFIKDTDIYE